MTRKFAIALNILCLFSTDLDAARRGGLRARWSSRRTARISTPDVRYATPQAVWNAHYRALVRGDWGAIYRCLDHESRRQAVANLAFGIIFRVSRDDDVAKLERLVRRHRLNLEAMAIDFNRAYESRMPKHHEVFSVNETPMIRDFAAVKGTLVRHIPHPAAFYRDAMREVMSDPKELMTMSAPTGDGGPQPALHKPRPCAHEPPILEELRLDGNHAEATYPNGSAVVEGDKFMLVDTVEFTYENDGWRMRELDWSSPSEEISK